MAKAAETVTAEKADAELVEQAKAAPADVFGSAAGSGPRSTVKTTARRSSSGSAATGRVTTGLVMTGWRCSSPRSTSRLVTPSGRRSNNAEELWRDDGGRDGNPAEMRTRRAAHGRHVRPSSSPATPVQPVGRPVRRIRGINST
ncbi:MAG: hypothetical protein R2695_13050 [Acidimicrobiales bacterium]